MSHCAPRYTTRWDELPTNSSLLVLL
ncbi:MAG: DUF4113 domain-containing protein [Alphaproteobacteria bacterium]|nr:DUF4113 domain-containing protein [Alphaproteobacteria bacterium]